MRKSRAKSPADGAFKPLRKSGKLANECLEESKVDTVMYKKDSFIASNREMLISYGSSVSELESRYVIFPPLLSISWINLSTSIFVKKVSTGLRPMPSCDAIKFRYDVPICDGGMLMVNFSRYDALPTKTE